MKQLVGICAMFSVIIGLALGALLTGCSALGVGAPVGRVLPLQVKESGELGRCASSGYEVDVPPHATVATVASVCVRPYRALSDGGASSAADELVHELEDGGRRGD